MNVGNKVICLNEEYASDKVFEVGEIEKIVDSWLLGDEVAIVKYEDGTLKKIPLFELKEYNKNMEGRYITVNQFLSALEKHLDPVTRAILHSRLDAVGKELFN